MRDVRRLIVAGPWPVQAGFYLVCLVVVGWPLLLRTEGPPFAALWSVVAGLALTVLQRRQDARDTGWTTTEQYDIVQRAYAGELSADPADRDALHRVLTRYAPGTALLALVRAGAVHRLRRAAVVWRGTFRGWSEWPVAAYLVLLGVALFVLLRRRNARRRALLARLEGVSDAAGG